MYFISWRKDLVFTFIISKKYINKNRKNTSILLYKYDKKKKPHLLQISAILSNIFIVKGPICPVKKSSFPGIFKIVPQNQNP